MNSDCEYGKWTTWSECNNDGYQSRYRPINKLAEGNGLECSKIVDDYTQTRKCSIDCRYTDWSDWTPCNNNGILTRNRSVFKPGDYGGSDCAYNYDAYMQVNKCPVDCSYNISEWSECSRACGGGMKTRKSDIIINPLNNGLPCPDVSLSNVCNTQNCPTVTFYSTTEYGRWGGRSRTLGYGVYYKQDLINLGLDDNIRSIKFNNGATYVKVFGNDNLNSTTNGSDGVELIRSVANTSNILPNGAQISSLIVGPSVCLYSQPNYGGNAIVLPIGYFTTSELMNIKNLFNKNNMPNYIDNSLDSIKLCGARAVQVFENDKFNEISGESKRFTTDQPTLSVGRLNGIISSIIVEA